MASSHLLAGHSRSGSDADFNNSEYLTSASNDYTAFSHGSSHPAKVDMLEHDYVPVRDVPPSESFMDNKIPPEKANLDAVVDVLPGEGRLHTWKPFYLRRRFLYSFVILFAGMIGTIQALLSVSDKHSGLATSFADLHYLWTYGPTAILTVVAAVWTRVEYQSKLIAPWVRLSKGSAGAERSVLLDYISKFQPLSIFAALKNRDTAVSAITTVSIILKVTIVISTALITLTLTEVRRLDTPVTLNSQFVNDTSGLESIGSLPYSAMIGIKYGNTDLPEGLSQQFAYQQVSSLLRPTAEIRTTVDGFAGGLNCESASANVTSLSETAGGPSPLWNLTVTAPQCEMKMTGLLAPALNFTSGSDKNYPTYFARFLTGACNGSSDQDDQRIIVMFGRLNYTLVRGTKLIGGHYDNHYELNMFESTPSSCTPTYNLSKVDIVKNGTDLLNITWASDAKSGTLDAVHPWTIAKAYIDSFANLISNSGGYQLETNITAGVSADVDAYFKLAFDTRSVPVQASSLFDKQTLQDFFGSYWTQYAAIIAHTGLMEPITQTSTAVAYVNEDRLLVRPLAGYLMEGFLGAAILLILIAGYTAPSKPILPRSPGTILGVAALVSHSQHLVTTLKQSGFASVAGISEQLRGSRYLLASSNKDSKSSYASGVFQVLPESQVLGDHNHAAETGVVNTREPMERTRHPTTLNPGLRITIIVLLLGLIAAMEATLRTSETRDGLGDVSDDTYLHFLWTTVPAIVLSLLGMYIAAVDFKVRTLVPFINMKRCSSFQSSVDLDLLDLFTPHMIWREIRVRHVAALAATLAALIASITTIFSGSLFLAISTPVTSSALLRTQDLFATSWSADSNLDLQAADEEASAASLILVSNLTYPAFTYENLAFPKFLLDSDFSTPSASGTLNSSSVVVNVTIPALRSRIDCRLYTSSEIVTNLTVNYQDEYGNWSPLALNITEEACRSMYGSNIIMATGNLTASRYFGKGNQADGTEFVEACSDYLFSWGRLDMDTNPPTATPMALGCNESFEAVDAYTSFLGSQLLIDVDNPPVPSNTSSSIFVASPNTTYRLTSIYETLANISSKTDALDTFFAHLTTSRYAVPISDLGDASQAQAVLDGITFQHGVIRAQSLNANYRVGINESANDTGGVPRLAVDPEYNVTATDPLGRRRVVQDEASTRVLQAMLAATLVFFLLNWGLMRDTDSLPRSPTGIASVAALIAGGNILDHLPEDAEHLSDKELEGTAFGDGAMFLMGWGRTGNQGGELAADVDNGETFGIWVVQRDDNLVEQREHK